VGAAPPDDRAAPPDDHVYVVNRCFPRCARLGKHRYAVGSGDAGATGRCRHVRPGRTTGAPSGRTTGELSGRRTGVPAC